MSEPTTWVQSVKPFDADSFDWELNKGNARNWMRGEPLASPYGDVSAVVVVSVVERVDRRGVAQATITYRLIEP